LDTAAIGNGSLSKTITASVKQISPSDTATIPVGSGTYGECVVKQMKRFGIMVIEKKLPKSDLREVDSCIYPTFIGGSNRRKAIFFNDAVSW
jgi:hypothetical protein